MVITHSKGNKTQRPTKKAPKLERHLSGSKDSRRKPCIVSLIHTWAPPYREELIELRKATTPIENRVVSLIHTWAPPYREELIELRKATTPIENRVVSHIHTWAPPYREELKELRRLPRRSNTLRKPLARRRTLKG
jgi:hypothetical protein